MKLHVKAKDQVIVIAGKDKGKKGSVVTAFPKTGKVIVEGVNIVTKHQKPRGQGMPARYGWKVNADGSKTRICKKCHEQID